jgi:adenylate cyclase
MGVEIERKFLVVGEPWRGVPGDEILQAYVASQAGRVVRLRARAGQGWLTIKGPTVGLSRAEFEVPVPVEQVREMVTALGLPGLIHKVRHLVEHAGHTWEIDVFSGENAGLVVAEIELAAEDEPFERPPWVGEEVTYDGRYANSALSERPWRTWGTS